MATWRKVIVSGSSAVLNQISASGNIVPISDAGSDLGSSTLEWKDLYIDGTANIDSLVADTADINGGTVDGITSLTAGGNLDIGAHGFRANTLTADNQTSGRVAIYSTAGLLSEDSDLTFSGDTLTATKVSAGAAGNFTVDGLVLTADTITNDAALEVVSTGLTLNASLDIALSADGGNVTMDDGTTTAFDFNVDDVELKIHDDAQVANYASIAVGNNGATTITTVDADAAAANLIITADGTVDIDSAGLITLDSGAAINLEPAAGSAVLIDGNISIDGSVVTGASSITSTTFVGALDGAIGGTTPAAGVFTTVSASGVITAQTGIIPDANDGAYLGQAGTAFSDLFLAEGGVINWDSGDLSLTQAGDVLTLGGDGSPTLTATLTNALSITANGGIGMTTYNASAAVSNLSLDIDGMTDIGAGIASGDLIIVDDGAGGTNRKSTIDRVATLFAGDGLQASSAVMAIDVSDFVGTGLEADGEDIRLAAQGTGISGGAGSTLSITPAQTAITSIYNTALKIGRASGDTYIDMGTADDNIDFYAGATKIIDLTTSGIDVTGALTVSSNATIEGNLIVNGDTTTLSTTNLAVGDQFIFAATGSAGTNVDAGLIVQSGSAVDSGSALYHDTTSERWAVASGVSSIAQAVTPGQMVTTTTLSTSEPGSSDGDYGVGEMWVDTDDQTIWVRTA